MDDRTLLELAAKATGADIRLISTDYEHCFKVPYSAPGVKGWREWNPLADDGDALRLAVKLQMEVTIYSVCTNAQPYGGNVTREVGEDLGMFATTRRAIVRAAAAIVEAMP